MWVDAEQLEQLIREERVKSHQITEDLRERAALRPADPGMQRAASYEAGRHAGLTLALHILRTEAEALAPARSA